MRKIKALALAAVMLVGISALPLQVKANPGCQPFIVICYDLYYVTGEVCGASAEDRQIAVEMNAEDICHFNV